MDIERTRRLLANPASTRDELRLLLQEARAAREIDLEDEIQDVIDERFPEYLAPSHVEATAIATFRSQRREFSTAKYAYVWLAEKFVKEKPDLFTEVQWDLRYFALGTQRMENGRPKRNYFARSPERLFSNSPHLAHSSHKYVQLSNGWYANLVLNNREKFRILCRFGISADLEHPTGWEWDVAEPSDDLAKATAEILASEKLIAELNNI